MMTEDPKQSTVSNKHNRGMKSPTKTFEMEIGDCREAETKKAGPVSRWVTLSRKCYQFLAIDSTATATDRRATHRPPMVHRRRASARKLFEPSVTSFMDPELDECVELFTLDLLLNRY